MPKFAGWSLLLLIVTSISRAQCPLPVPSECSDGAPPNASTAQSWGPGEITVVINSSDFPTAEDQSNIKQAFNHWQNTVSGVSFKFTADPNPKNAILNAVVVQKAGLPNANQVGHTEWSMMQPGSSAIYPNIQYATMTIDTSVAGSYLQNVVAHEIGHTYGQTDCTSCDSIMRYPITTSSTVYPTACDLQNVRYDTSCTLTGKAGCHAGIQGPISPFYLPRQRGSLVNVIFNRTSLTERLSLD